MFPFAYDLGGWAGMSKSISAKEMDVPAMCLYVFLCRKRGEKQQKNIKILKIYRWFISEMFFPWLESHPNQKNRT